MAVVLPQSADLATLTCKKADGGWFTGKEGWVELTRSNQAGCYVVAMGDEGKRDAHLSGGWSTALEKHYLTIFEGSAVYRSFEETGIRCLGFLGLSEYGSYDRAIKSSVPQQFVFVTMLSPPDADSHLVPQYKTF